MPENYIGIMCGTSLDSLDLSLCDFEKNKKIKYFKSYRILLDLARFSGPEIIISTTKSPLTQIAPKFISRNIY